MVFFNPAEKYRGPGSATPGIPRDRRERELQAMVANQDGKEIISILYKEATGTPHGIALPGVFVRTEMIPAILAHEYPQ
jgi:hypothetical protein